MLRTIITALTKSGAQYTFTIEGDVITCDRYEGLQASIDLSSMRRIGDRHMTLEVLPNIQIGRALLMRRFGDSPLISTEVTDVSAISSYSHY